MGVLPACTRLWIASTATGGGSGGWGGEVGTDSARTPRSGRSRRNHLSCSLDLQMGGQFQTGKLLTHCNTSVSSTILLTRHHHQKDP